MIITYLELREQESAMRVVDGRICNDTNQSNAHSTVNHDTDSVNIKTSIMLSKQQYDMIVSILDDIARYRCTRGDALLILCRMHYQDKQQQAVFFRLRDQDRVRRLLSVTYIAKTNVHSLGLNT
ncbi:MAG: hypothetical protein QXE95_04240 [Candidatus Nitrosocaldus sp.]